MTKLAVLGAAGTMGRLIVSRLRDDRTYQLCLVESGKDKEERLREQGLTPSSHSEGLRDAEVVILAVPDSLIGAVAAEAVPKMPTGTLVICLDAAAPYAGKLPLRKDIAYFVTHPTHPSVFNSENDPVARRDFFGRGKARQSIVSALLQGSEQDYVKGEALAQQIFGPILRSHRVTLRQMIILEPILSEAIAATCLTVMREALDEAVQRGVPEDAARDFILGHINVELAILFNEIDHSPSAGAQRAIEETMPQLFRSDWRKIFEPESIERLVGRIVVGES